MGNAEVLVAGAGPTGLALALWLARLGVHVRIIDPSASPGLTSRALAVQARTLELYRQLDLAEAVVERGHRVPAVNLWARGAHAARVPFADIGAGLTPYPFLEIFPQDEHERLLIERLGKLGVEVERCVELVDFSERPEGLIARLRRTSGEEECAARYVAGCDGAHSRVRAVIGTGFPGGTYRQMFYVADLEAAGPPVNGELHIDLDEADFLAVFPLADRGRVRLIGTVRDERAEHPETLKFDDVSVRAVEHMRLEVRAVHWFSTYRVHHRVSEQFRRGRAFLLGDAAHIHSPAGGQGMNTGIGDAVNLAWKLAEVIAGRAQEKLLDSYEPERSAFARRLVATTDRVFTFATAEGVVADFARTRLAPLLAPPLLRLETMRELLFRTVSQLMIHYRRSDLSEGIAGRVHGGDRLPWAAVEGKDNFAPLAEPRWQVHLYGTPPADLEAWCAARSVPLHVFTWHARYGEVGLERDALYLLRPDSYVALAAAPASAGVLEDYASSRGLSLGAGSPRTASSTLE
ncbi:MAG TPA: FAD-dependent monooxygenase [Steroidobacteraceae bacterium]|nr:FAD-dependent monooxygenase [Steroidobacteraceae bacterium]